MKKIKESILRELVIDLSKINMVIQPMLLMFMLVNVIPANVVDILTAEEFVKFLDFKFLEKNKFNKIKNSLFKILIF
jgi:hypothetical protein